MAKTLRAPFNFVPLNDKVYFPDWAEQVSQDVPFSDGVSGTLELTIKAETPIFIKNGAAQEKEENKNNNHYEFSHTADGRYFIPATSIKGAIRSVLEIISFGKLTQVENQSFGIRALAGPDYTFYKKVLSSDNIYCGWLRREGNTYYIDNCGKPYRISADEIASKVGKHFKDFIEGKLYDLKEDENRTAQKKYNLLSDFDFDKYKFSIDKDHQKANPKDNRKFVKFGNDFPGTIVFTGQSSRRKLETDKKTGKLKWTGKFYEFVFPHKIERKDIAVSKYVIKEFETIHKNSTDFKDFRKKDLDSGKAIPIFFTFDDNKKNITSIGLSYMYKYPAFNTVFDGIDDDLLDSEQHDFSECLFGYADKDDSMKGRIQFGHAFLETHPCFCEEKAIALSSPHPSYFPLYLGNGKSWNSETVVLAGRKRYPIRNRIESNSGSKGMIFHIKPLDKGSIFKGKVKFHNLRPEELGGILNAINFWNDNHYYHNLGQGKPLGYGKVRINAVISKLTSISSKYSEDTNFASIFQNKMEEFTPNWHDSVELRELRLMSIGIPKGRDDEFTYMQMDKNEFKNGLDKYNKEGEQLGLFSQIINRDIPKIYPEGNVNSDKHRISKEERLDKQKKEKRQKKEMQEKLEETLKEIADLLESKRYSEFFNLLNDNHYLSNSPAISKYINEIRQQENELTVEAESLEANKEFDKAIELYKKAEDLCLNNFSSQIENCKKNKIAFEEQETMKKEQTLVGEAKTLQQEKKYSAAIEKYKEAQEIGLNDYSVQIQDCKLAMIDGEKFSGGIQTFLDKVVIASPPAFASNLKKKYDGCEIPNEEAKLIAEKIKVAIENDKKKKAQWENPNNWKDYPKKIGLDNANKLYQLLFDEPLS